MDAFVMGPFTGTANCVRVSFGSPAGARVAALRPLMARTLVGFLVIAVSVVASASSGVMSTRSSTLSCAIYATIFGKFRVANSPKCRIAAMS